MPRGGLQVVNNSQHPLPTQHQLPTAAMMHQHLLPTALAALIWAQAVYAGDVRNAFTGRAQILVLNSTSFEGVTREQKVGCLNAHGMLTADDCAVFTREDDFPNMLSTKKGKCTFRDPNMPTNRDSIYGRDTHAWSCGTAADERSSEVYYTVVSLSINSPLSCLVALDRGRLTGPG